MTREYEYPNTELVHHELNDLIDNAYKELRNKFTKTCKDLTIKLEEESESNITIFYPLKDKLLAKLKEKKTNTLETPENIKAKKTIEKKIKNLTNADEKQGVNILTSALNEISEDLTEENITELQSQIATCKESYQKYKATKEKLEATEKQLDRVKINNIASCCIIIHSDIAENREFIIQLLDDSGEPLGFNYTATEDRKERLKGSVGPIGTSKNNPMLYCHSETGLTSIWLKGNSIQEIIKPELDKHRGNGRVAILFNTQRSCCWVCERVIPKFALTIAQKLDISLAEIDISIRYNEEYDGREKRDVELARLRTKDNIVLGKAKELLKERFSKIENEEEIKNKVLNRIIEFAISNLEKTSDLLNIEINDIKSALESLTESQNEELANDLNREIDASQIRSNTEKLAELAENISFTRITGTSVTSKEVLESSPGPKEFNVAIFGTPSSRKIHTKRTKESPGTNAKLPISEGSPNTSADLSILDTAKKSSPIITLYSAETDEKILTFSPSPQKRTPPTFPKSLYTQHRISDKKVRNESPAATGLRARNITAAASSSDKQVSPAARIIADAARSTSPAAAMGMAGADRSTSPAARSARPGERRDQDQPGASRRLF